MLDFIRHTARALVGLVGLVGLTACARGGPSALTMTPEQAGIVVREGHPSEMLSLKKQCQFVDMADAFHGEMELRSGAVSKGANVVAIIVESETHLVVTSHVETPNEHMTSTYHGAWDNASAVLFNCGE